MQDWETSDTPVGLEDINPAVVESTKAAMETPENAVGDVSVDVVRSNSFAFGYPTANGKLVTPKTAKATVSSLEEKELSACTFRPALVSSEKIRNKASSHNYGKAKVEVKAKSEAEVPSFQPNLDVGKGSSKKREASAGSQYGKVTAKKKEVKPVVPTFQPNLVDKGQSKVLREKAAPRFLESTKKFKEQGKNVRQLAQQKKTEISKYTLASDRPSTAPEQEKSKSMVFDNLTAKEKDPIYKRQVTTVPPVKPTKFGAKLKAKAASHYSAYTPPKGQKVKLKESPSWHSVKAGKETVIPGIEEMSQVKNKTKHNAVSSYSAATYKPPKVERPKTAPARSDNGFKTALVSQSSPLNKAASDLGRPKGSKRWGNVQSSGYGVVTPTPSVPAKVQSYKHRSAAGQIRTNDYREYANGRSSADSNVENEEPTITVGDQELIEDLIQKAASLDPGNAPAGGVLNEAQPVSQEESQLTML